MPKIRRRRFTVDGTMAKCLYPPPRRHLAGRPRSSRCRPEPARAAETRPTNGFSMTTPLAGGLEPRKQRVGYVRMRAEADEFFRGEDRVGDDDDPWERAERRRG